MTEDLAAACEAEDLPLLRGVATVTEAMRMLARGYDVMKFFPPRPMAAPALKSFAARCRRLFLSDRQGHAQECAGLSPACPMCSASGVRVASKALMSTGKWDEIEALAREASKLEE